MGRGNIPERHRGALARKHSREEAAYNQAAAAERRTMESYAAANPGYVFTGGEFAGGAVATFHRGEGTERIERTEIEVGRRNWTQPAVKVYRDGELVECVVGAREGLRSYQTTRDWVTKQSEQDGGCEYTMVNGGREAIHDVFIERTADAEGTISILRGNPVCMTDEGPEAVDHLTDPEDEGAPNQQGRSDAEGATESGRYRSGDSAGTTVGKQLDGPVIDADTIEERAAEMEGLVEAVYRALCRATNAQGEQGVSEERLLDEYYEGADGEAATPEEVREAVGTLLRYGEVYEADEGVYVPL